MDPWAPGRSPCRRTGTEPHADHGGKDCRGREEEDGAREALHDDRRELERSASIRVLGPPEVEGEGLPRLPEGFRHERLVKSSEHDSLLEFLFENLLLHIRRQAKVRWVRSALLDHAEANF